MQIHLCNKYFLMYKNKCHFAFEEDPLIYRIISSLMDWQVKRIQHTHIDTDTKDLHTNRES